MKRTSLFASAVFATLASAALVAGPAGGGGGGSAAAGGGGFGGAASSSGAGHAAAAGGGGHAGHSSTGGAHWSSSRTGSRLQSYRESSAQSPDDVRHITIDGKPAIAVGLRLDRPLRPEDERKLYWRGFKKVGHQQGPNNSPLFCSHSLYNGERKCVWFPPVPSISQ
jgi:hypothetical protein